MGGILDSIKSQTGNIHFAPGVTQAGIIIFLAFLLLIVMARMTRSYLSWYTSGWWIWTGLGFLLAVVIEGFFVISGSTIFTSILGWESAPKPVQSVIDTSRSKLIDVLGAEDTKPTSETIISGFYELDQESASKVRTSLCTPDVQ